MKKRIHILLFLITTLLTANLFAQKDTLQLNREARTLLREGNKLYNTEKSSKDKFEQAQAYHNIGNAMMEQKQYGPAVEAYKNSLRRNPNDDETRYNLAVAQKLKKKEEQNQQGDGDDNKDNKDQQNKDQNKKDKDKKDNKDQKDKKDGDDKDDQKNKDKGDQDQQNKKKDEGDKKDEQKEQPKPQQGKMSKEQIEQLLESLNNEEKKTQKKMNVQKGKGRKVKQEKDW